ncbi:MAG: hypothetical protein PVJ28_11310, partial [Acidimicrobiia bacterium]
MRLPIIDNLRRRYWRLQPAVQRKLKIAVPYSLLGLVVLAVAVAYGDAPDLAIWALFASLYITLEFFAVEVNDRLFQSSSIMVAMTAGVIFALDTGSSATLGMAVMGALGPLVPDDIRQRRWFQPLANFGQ